MFFETQERLEEIQGLFRRYDDHGSRAYRRQVVSRVLDLVTSDEIAQLGKTDWDILDLFYRKRKSPPSVAAILMMRESDFLARKTRAIKRLRDILEAPRNDWHRLVITRAAASDAAGVVQQDNGSVVETSSEDVTQTGHSLGELGVVCEPTATVEELWQEHDATTSYKEHRRILAAVFALLSDEQIARIQSRDLDVLRPYFAGKSDEQIARDLGYAKITVVQRRSRAKHRLRDISLGLTGEIPSEEFAEDTKATTDEATVVEQPREPQSFDFAVLWQQHEKESAYSQHRKLVAIAFAAAPAECLVKLEERELVALTAYVRGDTDTQIAVALKCSKMTAKRVKHSAIEHLKAATLGQDVPASRVSKRKATTAHRIDKVSPPRPQRKRGRKPYQQVMEAETDSTDIDDGEDKESVSRIPGVLKHWKYSSQEQDEAVAAFCADRTNLLHRRRVVETHLQTVRAIANKCYTLFEYGVERDDFVSLGIIGLLQAMEKFDLGMGIPLKGYAARRIKGAILDGFESESDKGTLLRKYQDLRSKERKGILTEKEMERLEQLQQLIFFDKELDTPVREDIDTLLVDTIQSPTLSPEELLIEAEYKIEKSARNAAIEETIVDAIHALPDREAHILYSRILHKTHFKKLGAEFKLSESRAVQLFQRAFKTVQAKVKARGLSSMD